MTNALDVLVIGGRSSEAAETALQRQGHRTHRCHEPDSSSFACAGLRDAADCPLQGNVDVAVLVRRGVQPLPLPEEAGVRCALRAGIPLVEEGVDILDPYQEWISSRVHAGEDLVSACVMAADDRFAQLRTLIRERIAKLAAGAGTSSIETACLIRSSGADLVIDLHLPVALDRRIQQALAVRVLDAVHASGRTFGQVDVNVHGDDAGLFESL